MKKTLSTLLLLTILLFSITAIAHQQTVVVPLGGNKVVTLVNFSGAWTPNTTYRAGETVEIDGSTYVCITAHISDPVRPNMAQWSLIAEKGIDGVDGLNCWDINANGDCDAGEDVNGGGCDASDCKGSPAIASAKLCLPPNYFVGIDSSGNIICDNYCDPDEIYGMDDSGNVQCIDCNGDISGTAYTDSCGKCVGGNTLKTECIHKKVFVSSTTHPGFLGGLVGADSICQDLADAAGLSGTYKAWLSDNLDIPGTRFTQDSSFGYFRVDGALVAADWDQLTSGTLSSPISIDEGGESQVQGDIGPMYVWTGTNSGGAALEPYFCSDWVSYSGNGYVGILSATNGNWTAETYDYCDSLHHIYCFEQ